MGYKSSSRFFLPLLLSSFLSLTIISGGVIPSITTASIEWYDVWAVIYTGDGDFSHYSAYMYQILREYHVCSDCIAYLDERRDIPGVDDVANKDNLMRALNWLSMVSDENDIVIIFIASHGFGFDAAVNNNNGGFLDKEIEGSFPGDEGFEHSSLVHSYGVYGIDEVIDQSITDDELIQKLTSIKCKYLILIAMTCYSGGLIDDVGYRANDFKAENIIVLTTANETGPGRAIPWKDASINTINETQGPWVQLFLDALHGERAYYNVSSHELVSLGKSVNADLNGDKVVSLYEAWKYARDNDKTDEEPWFDDDKDGLPTYKDDRNIYDYDQGYVASSVLFNVEEHVIRIKEFNNPPNKPILPDDSLYGSEDQPTTVSVAVGENSTYYIRVSDPDLDPAYIVVDWGDGITITDYVYSGDVVSVSHIWSSEGVYHVKAQAVDIYGSRSEWSEILVVEVSNNDSGGGSGGAGPGPGPPGGLPHPPPKIFGFNRLQLTEEIFGGHSSNAVIISQYILVSLKITAVRRVSWT